MKDCKIMFSWVPLHFVFTLSSSLLCFFRIHEQDFSSQHWRSVSWFQSLLDYNSCIDFWIIGYYYLSFWNSQKRSTCVVNYTFNFYMSPLFWRNQLTAANHTNIEPGRALYFSGRVNPLLKRPDTLKGTVCKGWSLGGPDGQPEPVPPPQMGQLRLTKSNNNGAFKLWHFNSAHNTQIMYKGDCNCMFLSVKICG